MKTLVVVMAVTLVGLAFSQIPATGAEKGLLDGKSFVGETGEKGKSKGDKDEFIFKDGTFRSTACDEYGFAEAPYKAVASGEQVTFEAETTSAKEGKILWKGTVKGDVLEGSFTWTKSGKTPAEYWLKGTLKR